MPTYYVSTAGNNANPGSIGSPFGTIAKGVSVLAAGDTLYIRAGHYANATTQRICSADMTTSGGSSYANAPLISGYPGETVVIDGTDGDLLAFNYGAGKSYWIIQDLTMDAIHWTGTDIGAHLLQCDVSNDHIRFQRLRLLNATAHTCYVAGNYVDLLNSYIDLNNRLNLGAQIGNGWYGAGDYQMVEGNEFVRMGGGGVRFFDSDLTHTATGCTARKNRIHTFSTNGPADGFGVLLGGTNHLAYNNLIYDGQGPGIQVQYGGSNSGNMAYNNTVYNVQSYAVLIDVGSGTTPVNTQIRNNLLYNNLVTMLDNGTASVTTPNQSTNPSYVNAAAENFALLRESTAIDAGVTLAAVPDDFIGTTRPKLLAYDIGAYEYNPVGGSGFLSFPR